MNEAMEMSASRKFMLFKNILIPMILSGRKTQTRRKRSGVWKVGDIVAVKNRPSSKPACFIQIVGKYRQRLGDLSLEDIRKEGFNNFEEFRKFWKKIYGEWNPKIFVTVYEFRVIKRRKK